MAISLNHKTLIFVALASSSLLLGCLEADEKSKPDSAKTGDGNAQGQKSDKAVARPMYSLSGTVSGLSGTLVLQNNGADELTITVDGAFTFATTLVDASAYKVEVKSQPSGKTCSIANNSGLVSGSHVTNVKVHCASDEYNIGGTVTGLTGTLVLQNNGGDQLTLAASGTFVFEKKVASGATYNVTVVSQPTGASCSLGNATGTVGGEAVSRIAITCAANTFTIGGTVTGLSGTLVLQNNGDNKTITTNGAFNFDTAIAYNGGYSVSVLQQSSDQVCVVTNNSGTAAANVTNVTVACTSMYSVGGNVSGLTGSVVLRNNGGDDLTVDGNGPFLFNTRFVNAATYTVTVKTQPETWSCNVTNGSGTIVGANVTTVAVACGPKKIFVTAERFTGNLGGVSGADAKCNAASNKPSGVGTYKALIAATSRRACSIENCGAGSTSLDWVLTPNTAYIRGIGSPLLVGVTNVNGIFDLPLSNSVREGGTWSETAVWTGISRDWITSFNCFDWTFSRWDSTVDGVIGYSQVVTDRPFSYGPIVCDDTGPRARLYCVEQ